MRTPPVIRTATRETIRVFVPVISILDEIDALDQDYQKTRGVDAVRIPSSALVNST
jgi:hypothetical protein